MTTRTAAAMAFFGLLLVFGAVGGMEDAAKVDLFLEQLATAIVGLGLMFCGAVGLQNREPDHE